MIKIIDREILEMLCNDIATSGVNDDNIKMLEANLLTTLDKAYVEDPSNFYPAISAWLEAVKEIDAQDVGLKIFVSRATVGDYKKGLGPRLMRHTVQRQYRSMLDSNTFDDPIVATDIKIKRIGHGIGLIYDPSEL